MKSFLSGLIFFCSLTAASEVAAQSYSGGWVFLPQSQNRAEELWLGDGNSYGLHMRGTDRYCGVSGDSYAHMRNVLRQTRGSIDGFIYWWIDRSCSDGYVRVCMENHVRSTGCSTYRNLGWGARPR